MPLKGTQTWRLHTKPYKGRTIRKVMGGGEQKKIMQGKMPRKKNSCEEEGKEKNSCRRRSHCDFFRKSEFQKPTILPGTI